MESVSLQQLIKDCASQVNDLYEGVTTSAGIFTDTLVDTGLSNVGGTIMADNQFAGSQAIFEEPAATNSGHSTPGPHNVVANVAATGVLTVNPPLRASGVVAAALRYFLIRGGGRGRPYSTYVAAIRYALDELNVSAAVTDSSLTTAADVYEYALPSTISGVYKVNLVKTGYTDLQLLPRDWGMKPGRKLWLKNTNIYVGFGWTLKVYGELESPVPATLDGVVYCPRSTVADLAVEYLQRNRTNPADNQRASQRQQERLRFQRMAPRNNLRRVIP
jgi:hypothetical protein